jgi:hypothetical protein
MFGSGLHGIWRKLKKNQILVGVATISWTIWLNRNGIVFNNAKSNTVLQVIFRRPIESARSLLHREEEAQAKFKDGWRLMEMVIMEVFDKLGWRFRNRTGI